MPENIYDTNETQMKSLGETILDIVSILVKWRRFFLWFVLTITVSAAVVTLFLPKWYKATASVFPAEQADLFGGLDGISSIVKTFSSSSKLSSLTGPKEVDRYLAILKSERVLGEVINKFNLYDVYELTDAVYKNEKARKELSSNTELEIQEEGNLTISVFDKEPLRAAEIANYYVELLNKTNSELQVQNARGNRLFIEQRYEKNIQELRTAEESLKTFQLKHGVLALPEQTEASIKAGAEVYARLNLKEIEIEVLKKTLGESHPNIAEKKIEIEAIKNKIHEMNTGNSSSPEDMKLLIPFRQTPELAIEYIRLFRGVEIQYKILQFITPLYEQAKVEENRSTPSVVVLDNAVPAERKAKPKVTLFALLAFVVSTLIALLFIFFAEALHRLKKMDQERYNAIAVTLRTDWFGLLLKSRNKSE